MESKKVLIGLVAAVAVSSASASVSSPTVAAEKQAHAQVMSKIFGNVALDMHHPECTIKENVA